MLRPIEQLDRNVPATGFHVTGPIDLPIQLAQLGVKVDGLRFERRFIDRAGDKRPHQPVLLAGELRAPPRHGRLLAIPLLGLEGEDLLQRMAEPGRDLRGG